MIATATALSCDAEPIHVPGAIQPHGVLVAMHPQTLKISQVSANSTNLFGAAPSQVLGKTLLTLLGGSGDRLLTALATNKLSNGEPLFAEIDGRAFDVRAHRHQGVAIVEFERQAAPGQLAATTDAMLRSALSRLQRPEGLGDVCSVMVEEVRKLTGFDRVLLYQFDEEGHGDVIEEDRADDVEAYWGHRFPATDIPRQARELYVLNWLRLIPDATYTPVPLVPELRPDEGLPLDLSFSTLRSVSPIHLQYLQNMGVRASMSVSLVRNGKLWGLIACHHRFARHVNFATRAACEVIGRVASLQIAALEEIESRVFRRARSSVEAKLVNAMHNTQEEPALALLQRGDALLTLVDASGAAVCTSAGIRTVGATPSAIQIDALLLWIAKEGCASTLHTDRLSERHPPAADYASLASGLLALSLPASLARTCSGFVRNWYAR